MTRARARACALGSRARATPVNSSAARGRRRRSCRSPRLSFAGHRVRGSSRYLRRTRIRCGAALARKFVANRTLHWASPSAHVYSARHASCGLCEAHGKHAPRVFRGTGATRDRATLSRQWPHLLHALGQRRGCGSRVRARTKCSTAFSDQIWEALTCASAVCWHALPARRAVVRTLAWEACGTGRFVARPVCAASGTLPCTQRDSHASVCTTLLYSSRSGTPALRSPP